MRLIIRIAISVAVTTATVYGCTTTENGTDQAQVTTKKIKKKRVKHVTPIRPYAQLDALDAITAKRDDLPNYVRDIREILIAREREESGDHEGATQAWLEALRLGRGAFGRMALEGWIKSYTEQLGKPSDISVLARLLMVETQNGSYSIYMSHAGLNSEDSLKPILRQLVPQWLSAEATSPQPRVETDLSADPDIKGGDPLLLKAAALYCQKNQLKQANWQTWQQSLSEPMRDYWRGLTTQQCGSGAASAITLFRGVYLKLAENRATQAMAVEAAGRCVTLQRAIGLRIEAADTYADLVRLWGTQGVSGESMGMDPISMSLRRIDETLWAARYRALVGDLENAKLFAIDGLKLARDTLKAKHRELKKSQREQLAALTADAYHTLASRVAVELRHYNSAVSLTSLAIKTPEVSAQWRERLQWATGVYEYLNGNFAGAMAAWQKVQDSTQDETQKIAAMFWQARCLDKLGRTAEAEIAIANLVTRYPLSYYAVVAAGESGMITPGEWQKPLGDLTELADRLAESRDFHLQELRSHPRLGPLLQRAEELVAANLPHLAKLAVGELEAEMSSRLAPKTSIGAYVYLSRLQYRSGAYLAAIGLTGRLARIDADFWQSWPEQLLIYFPQPYSDLYDEHAHESRVPKSLLLGISRQESGFTAEIRSSANAIGVMQLIPPTAKKYAAELRLPAGKIEDQLRDPNTNIRLGSHYLQLLSSNYQGFAPAVYGSYNAGEFAMDAWLKRRSQSDPLLFVELVPFGETRDYIKNVWRNVSVYDRISDLKAGLVEPGLDLGFAAHEGA